MTAYRYKATDPDGNEAAGRVDASSVEQARRLLEGRGLHVIEIAPEAADEKEKKGLGRLNSDESDQVAQRLAQISTASLPLAPGLRAAAEESGNRRVAAALESLADQLEQGRSLEDILTSSPCLFPRHISGLLLAAARTGKLGDALFELAEHQRAARDLRRSIAASFAYPLFVICLTAAVLVFIVFFVTGPFERMYDEFGLKLPQLTELLLWCHDVGLWRLLVAVAVLLAAAGALRLVLGAPGWFRLIATAPIIGPLLRWSGAAQWCSLLSVLVATEIPLPEALRLAAGGLGQIDLAKASLRWADGVDRGRPLSQMLAETPSFPSSAVPLIRWGEQTGLLSEALATGQAMFEKRVRMRAMMLRAILPPILFIVVGCFVLFVLLALFLPLYVLVQGLSG